EPVTVCPFARNSPAREPMAVPAMPMRWKCMMLRCLARDGEDGRTDHWKVLQAGRARHAHAPFRYPSLASVRLGPSFRGGGDAMEANRSRMRWTYEEFVRLPSEGSARYEVIDGELAVTPAPTSTHQRAI